MYLIPQTKPLMLMSNDMVPFSVGLQATTYGRDLDSVHPVQAEITQGHPPVPHGESALPSQEQSPMSEGSYHEEPSPVPEPTLPADFAIEEQQYREFEEDFDTKADIGYKDFVDRYEEMLTEIPATLPEEEVPPLDDSFKVTLGDITPPNIISRDFQKSSEEEEDDEPKEEGTAIP